MGLGSVGLGLKILQVRQVVDGPALWRDGLGAIHGLDETWALIVRYRGQKSADNGMQAGVEAANIIMTRDAIEQQRESRGDEAERVGVQERQGRKA